MPATPDDVRRRVLTCTRCQLHRVARAPVPWSGPVGASVAVLGEAPGEQEDLAGEPFVGPSGQLLRKYLRRVGLTPSELVFVNTVCCYPTRTPRPEEVDACRGNFWAQMVLVRPDFVLVVGGTALQALRPGARITTERGTPWIRELIDGGRRVYFPTYHPAAVLRNRLLSRIWREDLEQFKELVDGGQVPREQPRDR
jgi:uracil-DNA glycosylase family 4